MILYENVKGEDSAVKKILLLGTGGTISSGGSDGLKPALSVDQIIMKVPGISDCFEISSEDILSLDSSNIQPEEWSYIASKINETYKSYDGIVITHGTDTLSYTACALSFMLRGIPVPVVLTGSQLPINDPLTDAFENLRHAFAMASSGKGGVFVAFGGKIILGCRAVKVRTVGFNAFESVNHPYVADICANARLLPDDTSLPPAIEYRFKPNASGNVFLIKLTPGFSPEIFDMLLEMGYDGIVIEAFGAGGLHYLHRDLPAKLGKFAEHEVPVIITSQCLYEKSDLRIYEVGRRVLESGAIDAGDMTTEAAFVKLKWMLGNGMTYAQIREKFRTNYAGEISLENTNNV